MTLGQSCRMKVKRPPRSDEECGWDASKAKCDWPELCEYRYELGDLNLGQSCRLRKRAIPKTDKDCKWDYSSAKCDFPQYCEYHYWIGDLTLDQSCVLIGSRDDHDKTYQRRGVYVVLQRCTMCSSGSVLVHLQFW